MYLLGREVVSVATTPSIPLSARYSFRSSTTFSISSPSLMYHIPKGPGNSLPVSPHDGYIFDGYIFDDSTELAYKLSALMFWVSV